MKFFNLTCPVGDERASALEIISRTKGSVIDSVKQLSRNHSGTTQGYLICKLVKELVPVKCTESGTVLQLLFCELRIEQDEVSYFRSKFYNKMGLDMNDAVKNLKINGSDVVVLHRPVVFLSLSGRSLVVEVGLVENQAVAVWKHRGDVLNKTIDLKSISNSIKLLDIKSLEDFYSISKTSKGSSKEAILSYFIKPIQFWKQEGQVVKAICFFREIKPNGKVGYFFKMVLHRSFAYKLYRAVENEYVVPRDIVIFVNPVIYMNTFYNSKFIVSLEPYILECGCKEKENLGFCKVEENVQTPTQDPSAKTLASLDGPPMEKISPNYPSSTAAVNIEGGSKLSKDSSYLILTSLLKPSKDTIHFQNLSLVSGYCNQSCLKMFMYLEIVWNVKKEPLCPRCYIVLNLCLCLELLALLKSSGKFVKVILVGEKAERFLQVSCKDFLDNDERRKLAVNVLESKYVNGSKYKAFKMKVSDVSHLQ